MKNNYHCLRDIKLNDYGIKSELPVHVILGIIDYTKLKIQEREQECGFLGSRLPD